MDANPLVSVLMTACNRENFIAEAIKSVIDSSYANWELIISDDCSKDNTVAIAKQYEQQDNRIKVFQNTINLGDYPNRNKVASYAIGEYLMYVDSDDKILKDGLKDCLSIMNKYPESSFGMRFYHVDSQPFELSSEDAISMHFFKAQILISGPGGTVIKKDFFKKINGYPEKYGPANDMYFNLKAVCYSSIVMIPFEFMYYRKHEGQEINNKQNYLFNNYLYVKDALDELPLGLSPEKKKWLQAKNKRRFFVNMANYFFSTFNIKNTIAILKRTEFKMKDAFHAIFQ